MNASQKRMPRSTGGERQDLRVANAGWSRFRGNPSDHGTAATAALATVQQMRGNQHKSAYRCKPRQDEAQPGGRDKRQPCHGVGTINRAPSCMGFTFGCTCSFTLGGTAFTVGIRRGNLCPMGLVCRTACAPRAERRERNHCQTETANDDGCQTSMLAETRDERTHSNRKTTDGHPLMKAFVRQKIQAEGWQVGDDKRHRRAMNRATDGCSHPQPVAPGANFRFFS